MFLILTLITLFIGKTNQEKITKCDLYYQKDCQNSYDQVQYYTNEQECEVHCDHDLFKSEVYLNCQLIGETCNCHSRDVHTFPFSTCQNIQDFDEETRKLAEEIWGLAYESVFCGGCEGDSTNTLFIVFVSVPCGVVVLVCFVCFVSFCVVCVVFVLGGGLCCCGRSNRVENYEEILKQEEDPSVPFF